MNKNTSFKPPIEVKNNARRALEVRRNKPRSERAMTRVGIARARDLASGRPQSLDTIKRMASFFARHEVDKKSANWGIGSRGWQAWMGWGGDAGRRWADRILANELKDTEESTTKKVMPSSANTPAINTPTLPADDKIAEPPMLIMSIDEFTTPPMADEEDHGGEGDGSMAKSQLLSIADKAAEVYQLFDNQTDLEPWVQSLITDATRQIGIVYDYVKYSMIPEELGMNKSLQKNDRVKEVKDNEGMSNFAKYAYFEKASPDQRVVVGYASSERIDGQNDIVDSDALRGALDDYMKWANLREMHQPKAVGKVLSATPISGVIQLKDGTKLVNPLRIIAKIVDEDAWQKVKSGILKGFSIGGKVKNAIVQKVNGKEVRRITDLVLNEISLVDRPANPDARIILMKRESVLDKHAIETHIKNGGNPEAIIAKAKMADPQDILPQIQNLRNQSEIDGDLETAERYNEVITLMLEAMGIIPTGTVREIDDMEEMGEDEYGAEDMMDMESLYDDDASKRSNSIMYASLITDLAKMGQASNDTLLKIGRAISKNNMDTLSDIYRAAKIITALTEKMGVQSEMESPSEAMSAHDDTMHESDSEKIDSIDEATAIREGDVSPDDGAEEVDAEMVITSEDEDQAIMDAIMNAPKKEMPGNNTGSPIHTSMNGESPAQNVKGGYPIQRSAKTEDLRKNASAVDIDQLVEEIEAMEKTVETPTSETVETSADTTEVSKSVAPAVDVTAALQDVIAKSLQGALSGTVTQMESVAKAVERIEKNHEEQTKSVWEVLKPLAESVEKTQETITPLLEKSVVSTLDSLTEVVNKIQERLEAIENQPVEGGAVLRGNVVNKSLSVEDAQPAKVSEADTIRKMIDETKNPIVRTQLQERLALIETKQALFGR